MTKFRDINISNEKKKKSSGGSNNISTAVAAQLFSFVVVFDVVFFSLSLIVVA